MSCAPRILRELHKTLLVISGYMFPSSLSIFADENYIENENLDDINYTVSHRPIPSSSESDLARAETRKQLLSRCIMKEFARELSERIKVQLGHLWHQADAASALRKPSSPPYVYPESDDDIYPSEKAKRSVLYFRRLLCQRTSVGIY